MAETYHINELGISIIVNMSRKSDVENQATGTAVLGVLTIANEPIL